LISRRFSQTRKSASILGSNRGPHDDALWNSHFNICLWETEFCAQRLPGEFDGRALRRLVGDVGAQLEPSLDQRRLQRTVRRERL
jgi:hypothetical protein